MKLRASILTVLLAATLGWFAFEQKRGRTHEPEQWFLDFLVANARETFSKSVPEESPDVVLVEFRETDKAEFSAWPPAPLDFIMVLKRLAEHEPAVVSIVEPLRWERADTEFVTQLRNALVPFPSVVLGFELAAEGAGMTEEQGDFSENEMPVLPSAEGDSRGIPSFVRIGMVPDWSLRIASQSGFSTLTGLKLPANVMPFVAHDGRRHVPSLAAQSVTLFRRVPYAEQRLRFGTGARLSLGDEFILPLNADGTFPLRDKPRVPAVNALDLMTPDLGDDAAKAVQTMLGKGKVVVMSAGGTGGPHARAIAGALAMPKVARIPAAMAWVFAGSMCLLCLWQLRHGRVKAVLSGVGFAIGGLVVCLLVFQSSLMWWSPLAAMLCVAVSTAFCFVWPAVGGTMVPRSGPD